jgi:ubiquitin-like protein Pup
VTEQERIQKQRTERTREETEDVTVVTKKGEQLKAELDDLLDEIDGVLEENAEEFVRTYVQKGGQ